MANVNATTIIKHATDNGWKVTVTETANVHEWRADKSCGTAVFDRPTHIVTFTRGDERATMPATPNAGMYAYVLDSKSMPKPNEITSWRYVRGNKADGQMLGTDGKPVLIGALAEQLAKRPAAKRAARKPRAAKTAS